MKRIIIFFTAIIAVICLAVPVSAEEESIIIDVFEVDDEDDNLGVSLDSSIFSSPGAITDFTILQNISLTYSISSSGTATGTVVVTGQKNKPGITVKMYMEKKTLGILWTRVKNGKDNNEWVDNTTGSFISCSHSLYLSDEGTYRVVVKVTTCGETYTKTSESTYKKGAVMGDANGDGIVTAADARLVLRFSAGLQSYNSAQKTICDMNSDGKLNASDARTILRKSAFLA